VLLKPGLMRSPMTVMSKDCDAVTVLLSGKC
jgi:hypothetical protein